MYPEDLKYHREHTWVRTQGKKAVVGITDYAQHSLGDIVYIELPEPEAAIEANSQLAEIESVKTTSTVICPVSGTVKEVNEDLTDIPEILNEDPHARGWIAVIEMETPSEVDELLDASEYDDYVEQEIKSA